MFMGHLSPHLFHKHKIKSKNAFSTAKQLPYIFTVSCLFFVIPNFEEFCRCGKYVRGFEILFPRISLTTLILHELY